MRELVFICVGQCGVQVGESLWSKLLREQLCFPNLHPDSQTNLYYASKSNTLLPRCIFVDLDDVTIDSLKKKAKGFGFTEFVSGKESSADNFSRGKYTIGKSLIDTVLSKTRRLVDGCSNLEGFVLIHSSMGGTGAGFTITLQERLHIEYPKKLLLSFVVCSSVDLANGPLEIFNTMSYFMEDRDTLSASILFNNQALYSSLEHQLGITNPDFSQINELISESISALLLGSREARLSSIDYSPCASGIGSIVESWVPFKRLNLIVPSVAPVEGVDCPFGSVGKSESEIMSLLLDFKLVNMRSRFAKEKKKKAQVFQAGFIERGVDSLMGVSLLSRAYEEIWKNQYCFFNEHAQFQQFRTPALPLEMGCSGSKRNSAGYRSVSAFVNSSEVADLLKVYIRKFDRLYEKRAFVHWIIGEGLDSGEMYELRANVENLAADYSIKF